MILNFEGQADGLTTDTIIAELIEEFRKSASRGSKE